MKHPNVAGPEQIVDVIITCDDCDAVVEALRKKQIEVTDTERAIVGSIGARIPRSQLETIRRTPGVEAVELDSEVRAL